MSTQVQTAIKTQSVVDEVGTAAKHSVVYGLGGMMTKAIGFIMLPLYTRYLSPGDYGVLEILDLTMTLLGMFLNMGIMAAMLRYYGSAASESERRKVVGTSFFFVIATGVVVLGLGWVFVPKASVLLLGPGISPWYLFLSFSFFVLGYIGNVPLTYFRAKEASGTLVISESITTALVLALNVYFLVVLKLSIVGILISPLIVGGARFVIFVWWMIRDMGFEVDFKRMRDLLSFGAPLVFSNVAMFTLNFSDRFFLRHFQSLDVVGIYSLGYKFGFMINFLLVQQFNMMWQARMYVIDGHPDRRKIFAQIFGLYSVLLTFAALGLALFSPEVIRVMVDPRFAASQKIIPVIALSYVFLGVGCYFQLGLYLSNRTGVIGLVSAVAALLNIALNYILVLRYGMVGAAWATVLGFGAIAVGSYYFSKRSMP